MKLFKKFFYTFIISLYPVFVIAQDGIGKNQSKTFLDFLLDYRYLTIIIIFIIGLYIIWNKRMSLKFRIPLLLFTFLFYGVIAYFVSAIYISPSPVCASTKIFTIGLRPQFFATLTVIGVLSLVSTKGFCGLVCPIGALQELFYRIPGVKKLKLKFVIINSVRILLFISFLLVFVLAGISLYNFINLFDLIHWDFNLPFLELFFFLLFIIIMLVMSIFLFRPFCYLICPFGLYSWILEQFSFLKVRISKNKCNQCGVCEQKAPCPAIGYIMKDKIIRADCHLCGDCLNLCNRDAIYFGLKKKE